MNDGWKMPALIAVLLIAVGGIIVYAVRADARWVAWCESQGGHVLRDTKWITTYVDGKVGSASTTTTYCLTADGRILGIQ